MVRIIHYIHNNKPRTSLIYLFLNTIIKLITLLSFTDAPRIPELVAGEVLYYFFFPFFSLFIGTKKG